MKEPEVEKSPEKIRLPQQAPKNQADLEIQRPCINFEIFSDPGCDTLEHLQRDILEITAKFESSTEACRALIHTDKHRFWHHQIFPVIAATIKPSA
jgi:hypothetical protein